MSNNKNKYLFIAFSVLLYSCEQDNRSRSKIPPTPFQTESIQNTASIEALTDAIRSNPSLAENYYKRAMVLNRMGETQKALEDINRADRLKQNTGKYLYVKALILRNMEQYREAYESAQSAEILNVDTPELYTLLGDLSQQRNDLKSAEQYLAKSLQIAPYDGETAFYQGTLAARKGDTTTALLKMSKAIEMKPSLKLAYSSLTEVLRNRRLFDSALAVNNSALIQFPKDSKFLIERGLVFNKFDRLDSAIFYFTKVLKIDEKELMRYFIQPQYISDGKNLIKHWSCTKRY